MASISKDRRGNRTIQFIARDKRRRSIRLGKLSAKVAIAIKAKVEALNAAAISRTSWNGETAAWLGELGCLLYDKLAAVQLVPPRPDAKHTTLGDFLDNYVKRRVDVKPATVEIWGQTVRNLKEFFGVGRDLRSINDGDAEDFKLHLVAEKLASTTIAKRLQFARMFFRDACKRGMVRENPFAGVSAVAVIDEARQHYVTVEDTQRLLAVCNREWRIIIGLCRFGGLRCPSEVLSLRWRDIGWSDGRIIITSPKTEHHQGKGRRIIPLFHELRPILEDAFKSAGDDDYLLPDFRTAALGPRGWRNCNLRTPFKRLIERAGLKPWPRLFHAMRGSRETDLAKEYPLHIVTTWLGNTPRIAFKHYLMVPDAEFARAAESGAANGRSKPRRPARIKKAPDESGAFAESCNPLRDTAQTNSGEDRIRTCGPGYPGHRFSKPAHSTTLPPLHGAVSPKSPTEVRKTRRRPSGR